MSDKTKDKREPQGLYPMTMHELKDPPEEFDSKGRPWNAKPNEKPKNLLHVAIGMVILIGVWGAMLWVTFSEASEQAELKQLESGETLSLSLCEEKARAYLLKSLDETPASTAAALKAQAWLTALQTGLCKP